MEFDSLLHECKVILLRVLNSEEHRFELSELAKRLVHKCSIFSAALHTLSIEHMRTSPLPSSDNSNIAALYLLRGCLLDVETFVSRHGARIVDDEQNSDLEKEYNTIAVRIARAAYKLLRNSPDKEKIGQFDLLQRDCRELLGLIFTVHPVGFVHPDDSARIVESCRVFEDILPKLQEDSTSVELLIKLEDILDDVVDFLYVTISSFMSSVIAKVIYSASKSAYHRSVVQLLVKLSHITHQLKHRIPRRFRSTHSTATVGFLVLLDDCKDRVSKMIHTDDVTFVNPTDGRRLINEVRDLKTPLYELEDTETSLCALEELNATLGVAKHFLEAYATSSVLGETTYHLVRSTYEKSWDDVMTRVAHDTHVLRRCVIVQKSTAGFRAEVAECQALLNAIRSVDDNRQLNPHDGNLLTRSCNDFAEILHGVSQSEENAARISDLKTTLQQVREFLEEFDVSSSLGSVIYSSNREEYSREFAEVLDRIDRAFVDFRTISDVDGVSGKSVKR